jgi:hypothetical protein
MEALILLVVVFLIGPPAAALYAFTRVRRLSNDVERLTKELRATQRAMRKAQRTAEAAVAGERPVSDTAAKTPNADEGRPEGASEPSEVDAGPRTEERFTPPIRPAASTAGFVPPRQPPATERDGTPAEPETSPDAGSLTEAEASPADAKPTADLPSAETLGADVPEAVTTEPSVDAPPLDDSRGTRDARGREGAEPKPPKSRELDLETLIGSTWLLRAGLGILAIALALFARSIAPQLPAAAKVAVAYAGSIGLFALGKFYEDRLEKFARPVMAGGLAFGFFVAFAAHFVPAMQAVSMPVSIAWMVVSMFTVLLAAERWESEYTALLAIVLGHLSAQVVAGDAELYTLVMIAFLAFTAIVLLLRHSWVMIGAAGVGLSYGAHMLWLFAERAPIDGDRGFWLNLAFLSSYYLIFLIADVLWWRRHSDAELDPTSGAARAARALGPTNLVLYASLTSLVYFVSGAAIESIEWYFVTLGTLQGVLAWIYRQSNHRDFVFYPAFGTILWTLGMFAAFDALALNLILAVQALLLLVAAHRTRLWIFHALAQLAMVVAFLEYLTGIGTPSGVGDLALFVGGLGIGSVYLLKGSLEEIWYGEGSAVDWFGEDEGASPLGFLGRAFGSKLESIAPALAPLHATLGGAIVAREALQYFGGGPELAAFLTVASIGVLAVVLARGRPALLFTVTTLAVGATVTLVAAEATRGPETVFALGALIVAAIAVVYLGPRRMDEHSDTLLLHGLAMAVLAMLGMFGTVPTAPPGTVMYLAWMLLPCLLIGYQIGADRLAAERADDTEIFNYSLLSVGMHIAFALLVVMLTEQWFGRTLAAPLWIASWALMGLGAATLWTHRGLFAIGYTILVCGYVVTLDPSATLSVWWAGLLVTAVPFLIAISLDRRLDEAAPPSTERLRSAGRVLPFVPYAIGLVVLSGYAFVMLPGGWALFSLALVGLALLLGADRLRIPRGVVSIVAAALAWQLLALSSRELAATTAALLPLLLFVGATLAIERVVQTWVTEERDHPLRPPVMIAMVVLATLVAVATVYASELIGPTGATAAWSVLGGSMMGLGFAVKSAIHRRLALLLLAICILRVFVVDTVGLSDTARIGAFLVLGLILVAIALLYARFSDRLKSWI